MTILVRGGRERPTRTWKETIIKDMKLAELTKDTTKNQVQWHNRIHIDKFTL